MEIKSVKNILIVVVIAVFSTTASPRCFENRVDSFAVIVRPDSISSEPLQRSQLVSYISRKLNSCPVYLFKDSVSIDSLAQIMSVFENGTELKQSTKQQILRLERDCEGKFDLRRGFLNEDTINVQAMIVLFKNGSSDIVWVGNHTFDIGKLRFDKAILHSIRHLVDRYRVVRSPHDYHGIVSEQQN